MTRRVTRKQLEGLNQRIVACEQCPRLVKYRQRIAREKRASFRDWDYHGAPVPNFYPAARPGEARVLIVGLAPAAHGANRTGRMFTGDRSGDFLFDVMHDVGFASQPEATDMNDGLKLIDCTITAACHCAPPANKPTADELATCSQWLVETFQTQPRVKVVLCLGKLALDAVLREWKAEGVIDAMSDYPFAHGAEYAIEGKPRLLCSFHPSQQNTFTGRLTRDMLLKVFARAREFVEGRG